jgi:hypothetical protein
MTEERKRNIIYIVFIIAIIIMAVIYFSVPERVKFFENQLKWWKEFREVFLSFIN